MKISHSLLTFAVKRVENLKDWKNGKKNSMSFAIPMVKREENHHITNRYFCMINLKGINRKNKHYVQYSDAPSAIRPIPQGPDLPVPEPDGNMEYSSDFEHSNMTFVAGDDAYKPEEDGRPVSTFDTSKTQRPDTRPEPFIRICSAAGFTSQRETSVDTRNNVLRVSRP